MTNWTLTLVVATLIKYKLDDRFNSSRWKNASRWFLGNTLHDDASEAPLNRKTEQTDWNESGI